MIKTNNIFCENIRMSIPEFLQVQRNEITLKQLKSNKKIDGIIGRLCENPSNKRALIVMLAGFLMKFSEVGIQNAVPVSNMGISLQGITGLLLSCSKIGLFSLILIRMRYCFAKAIIDKNCNTSDYTSECVKLTFIATLFSCLYR